MEEFGNCEDSWAEELVQELLDDESPVFLVSHKKESYNECITNKLISKVYSGPTIGDIERALSENFHTGERSSSVARVVPIVERGLSKVENKYTLRIKRTGNGLADDGYKWRKYGQKSIKNSPNPRSYYRCTNPRCNAKKQVERSIEDPETLLVTYEGLHLHYSYTHFIPPPQHHHSAAALQPPKKPRLLLPKSSSSLGAPQMDTNNGAAALEDILLSPARSPQEGILGSFMENPQDLQEEHVPLLTSTPCTSTKEPFLPSQVSSPTCSSTFSWASAAPFLDMGILSSMF